MGREAQDVEAALSNGAELVHRYEGARGASLIAVSCINQLHQGVAFVER